jgi:hypothetical protein
LILHGPVPGCRGDCNEDGIVAIDELVIGIDIAMGDDFCRCPAVGAADVSAVVTAVNNALAGCP